MLALGPLEEVLEDVAQRKVTDWMRLKEVFECYYERRSTAKLIETSLPLTVFKDCSCFGNSLRSSVQFLGNTVLTLVMVIFSYILSAERFQQPLHG